MTFTNPATIADVTSRSFRTLSTAEVATATTLIDDVYYLLLGSRYGQRMTEIMEVTDANPVVDPTFIHNLKRLIANSVLRVVYNPFGDLEQEGDDYRSRKDAVLSTGRLYILPAELTELFPDAGANNAFTIRPGYAGQFRRPLPENAFYEPLR